MSLKNVCVTMRVTNAQSYDEVRDSISHDWFNLLASWDMTTIPVPNIGPVAVDYVRRAAPALLILSGGEDIGASPVRDETEIALFKFALKNRLPVLGVCRGLQLMNVNLGGELGAVEGHVASVHDVDIDPAWQGFYGERTSVNSFHNIGIPQSTLAPRLQTMATDAEGHIEAVRHNDLPVAAIMWHPERHGAPDGDRRLIEALIAGRK